MGNPHLILLNAGTVSRDGDWNWKGISSPFARIFYVREGRAGLGLPSGSRDLLPGHMYMIPPFTLHSYECDCYFLHSYIHIYENPSPYSGILEEHDFPVEVEACPADLQLIERLLEINGGRELRQLDPRTYDNAPTLLENIAEQARRPAYAVVETGGILLQLLSRFLRYATPRANVADERIRRIAGYICRNMDKPLKISRLADMSNLSCDHFIRLFRREMNCTPVDYINRKKMEKAQLMLITGKQPVKDIAYALSFENISYFNRLFKSATRYTPIQYRQMFHGIEPGR